MDPLRVIDFDADSTWREPYTSLLQDLAPAATWTALRDSEDYGGHQTRLEALSKLSAPVGSGDPMTWLRSRARSFFGERFSHCVCYHACRIVDASSYERQGVQLSNIAAQNEVAVSIWGPSPELSEAIRSVRAGGYSSHNEGKVGLWYSRKGAVHAGDHYLNEGSEYLQVLASRLPPALRPMLKARGRAAVIRCVLPVAEMTGSTSTTYAMLPLEDALTVRDLEAPVTFYTVTYAFMHEFPVPPDRINIEYL